MLLAAVQKVLLAYRSEHFMYTGIAHFAMLQCGDLAQMRKMWMSMLLPPHTVAVRREDLFETRCLWIIKSTHVGALSLPGQIHFINGRTYVEISPRVTLDALFVSVLDHRDWYIHEYTGALPEHVDKATEGAMHDLGLCGLTLELKDIRPVPLMEFVARNECFNRFTLPQLWMIVEILGLSVPEPKPRLQHEVLRFLVENVLQPITSAEVGELLRSHACMQRHVESKITSENEHLTLEAVPEADQPSMKAEVAKHFTKKRKRAHADQDAQGCEFSSTARSSTDQCPADQAALSRRPTELLESGGSGGRSGKRASKKTERPVIGEYFTPVQARGLLPANIPGLHVTINAGAQWQVKYPRVTPGPKSHGRTWQSTGPNTHRRCMLECIQWAWDRHQEATGQSCPWDLSELKESDAGVSVLPIA